MTILLRSISSYVNSSIRVRQAANALSLFHPVADVQFSHQVSVMGGTWEKKSETFFSEKVSSDIQTTKRCRIFYRYLLYHLRGLRGISRMVSRSLDLSHDRSSRYSIGRRPPEAPVAAPMLTVRETQRAPKARLMCDRFKMPVVNCKA